jgi:hypothetical protein
MRAFFFFSKLPFVLIGVIVKKMVLILEQEFKHFDGPNFSEFQFNNVKKGAR